MLFTHLTWCVFNKLVLPFVLVYDMSLYTSITFNKLVVHIYHGVHSAYQFVSIQHCPSNILVFNVFNWIRCVRFLHCQQFASKIVLVHIPHIHIQYYVNSARVHTSSNCAHPCGMYPFSPGVHPASLIGHIQQQVPRSSYTHLTLTTFSMLLKHVQQWCTSNILVVVPTLFWLDILGLHKRPWRHILSLTVCHVPSTIASAIFFSLTLSLFYCLVYRTPFLSNLTQLSFWISVSALKPYKHAILLFSLALCLYACALLRCFLSVFFFCVCRTYLFILLFVFPFPPLWRKAEMRVVLSAEPWWSVGRRFLWLLLSMQSTP